MLFLPLSILAITIGFVSATQDISENGLAKLEPVTQQQFVQEYGPVYPAYCEDE